MTDLENEAPEHRLKRLHMRSWRRGMKEMDLILGQFADKALAGLGAPKMDLYERMLSENDQDLYKWVSGASPTPPVYAALISEIAGFHGITR